MIDGKVIKAGTITEDKIASLPSTPSGPNAPASKLYVDNSIQQSINNLDWKASVRTASGTNINIASPGTTIGGVTMNNGDRVLLYGQTTGSQNGFYVFNGSAAAMTRSTDADGASEVTPMAACLVEEGTDNGKLFRLTTTGAITLGTTSLTFAAFASIAGSAPSTANKFMTASVTTADGNEACATAMAATPAGSSFVGVVVSELFVEVGNGVKTKACYFSGDGGATARAFGAVVSGDKLYWNGSIAGYQLAATDQVSFLYNI
ncbi:MULTISPECIES: hypothetical protein [unclassified Paraflavitalea]|uniref:hypothetical protein n=1 Tax=unclassified Paraflavitalea TaxID=2798305 RepID=UPI003D35426D